MVSDQTILKKLNPDRLNPIFLTCSRGLELRRKIHRSYKKL